jgi:hypothetical protein
MSLPPQTFFLKIAKTLFWPALAVVFGLIFFGLALLPVHQPQINLKDYGGVEQAEEGHSFLWVKPGTVFKFYDLPRFAPIYLTIRMSLDRIEGAPPAHIELAEQQDQDKTQKLLASYDYRPELTGFQDYVIKIPSADKSQESFLLALNGNSFKAPGDPRELGVRVESIKLRLSPAGLTSLLYPRPYLLAVIFLMVGMAFWLSFLRFGRIETFGLLAATGFGCGVLANLLVYQSWFLLAVALFFVGSALWWQRQETAHLTAWRGILPLGLGLLLFSAFFVIVPGLPGDIYYWREVLQPIIQYGPIGVYPNAPRLVYPPGSVFFLWLYGIATQPFGISYNQSGLKALMGVSHFGLLGLLWYTGYRTGADKLVTARALALFGFSLSLVFVPLSWVQADGWLTLMMIAPIVLVVWGRPYSSALVQAVGVLYKAQSWLLLPLYALVYLWRAGGRRLLLGGALTLGVVAIFAGLGFAFDPAVFRVFWQQPAVSGESAWGGIRTFNILHALDYDQKQVPQPLLTISYGIVALSYAAILLVMWLRQRRYEQMSDKAERDRISLADWLLAAGLFFTIIFFAWVKMHERYLYFGLAFLPFVALWRRDMYKIAVFFNFFFLLNLLYAYLPERRDPVPNNFFLWRHALHADWFQNVLIAGGVIGCLWLAWLYFRPLILKNKS